MSFDSFVRPLFYCWLLLFGQAVQARERVVTIMPVGDSITEGGSSFSNWRYQLWEKLYTAGYLAEYVGTRKSPSRIGELMHEGYGGKNSAFLAKTVPDHFRQHPADVVLLHAGHNHFAEKKPVPQIIADTKTMIAAFRKVNPQVTILLAHPIPSGKLPKYSYLPDLYRELDALAKQMNTAQSKLVIVPMEQGFDPKKDTVADLVHPNEVGAKKMAAHWFEALVTVLPRPVVSYHPKLIPYKKTDRGDLRLHVFAPEKKSSSASAIVFFHGGGWSNGTPLQFYPECTELTRRGMVAISVEYRLAFTHRTQAFEAVEDGKSALRWVRQHARELGIDPRKIIAAGASAGGQIAAAAGSLPGFDAAGEDRLISSRPDACILWYPVIDNGPKGYGNAAVKARYQEFSPMHHISKSTPPTCIFLGTKDRLVPVSTVETYQQEMKKVGVRCEVELFEGCEHPIYSYRQPRADEAERVMKSTLRFLESLEM